MSKNVFDKANNKRHIMAFTKQYFKLYLQSPDKDDIL